MHNIIIYIYIAIHLSVALTLPKWTAPQPDPAKFLGGYTPIHDTRNTEIFHGTAPNDTSYISGAYNHGAVIDYFNGIFIVLWKNCPEMEDCNGQRILYSQSTDSVKWTAPEVMFQNLTVPQQPATLFVGQPIHINGREYVAASPAPWSSSNGAVPGAGWSLWPEPIDPRNCGPPGITQQLNHTLLMRQVLPGIGNIGPLFWASNIAPDIFVEATKTFNISTLNQMPLETQYDIHNLTKQMNGFCQNSGVGTLKCEVCPNGCQLFSEINPFEQIQSERTHYILPSKVQDVLLYRDGNHSTHILYASMRSMRIDNNNNTIYGNWTQPQITNVPNDISNINSGPLPDNRIYLVSNPVTPINQTHPTGRDPLTIATSIDGIKFDKVGVVMTCTNLSATSKCQPRYPGTAKNPGPSYPKAITIIDPAPENIQGLYVVATNNKEDVWITYMKFSTF